MKTFRILFLFTISSLFITSCVKDDFDKNNNESEGNETELEISSLDITSLKIPENFDFATHYEVEITIEDNEVGVIYDVYAYSNELIDMGPVTYINEEGQTVTENEYRSDVLNQLLYTGSPNSGSMIHTIAVPTSYDKLYVRRNKNRKFESKIIDILNNSATYTHIPSSGNKGISGKSGVEDYLYCVNGSAELFQVDPLTGVYTAISTMPMGSYTAAIDQENKMLYSIGRSSPYPLMKYSIVDDSWTTVANLGQGGPRLDYNTQDGLLYFSTKDILYSYDPQSGALLSTWDINGLDNVGGGDLAFHENGILYMCTFSGLYELTLNNDGSYDADRKSADNLPFNPTSMTFDSNQELWLASNGSSSDLIIMDTQTGGWQYNYGISANNDSDFGRTINDLTTFKVFVENPAEVDTDGDGIVDEDDAFPDESDKAFEMFTPSKYGYGTLAFEDLWPFQGDYDFNDIAVNYKVVAVQNAANEVVQVDFNIEVKSNGASFVNALGIELENLIPEQIESVTGTVLTQDYINLNANGTEANQDNAVIILYDDNYSMLNQPITVSVKFTTPLTTSELGSAPFNPFMIIDKTREKEVHLAYGHTTSLGQKNFVVEGVNKDPDGNYVTDEGLPWAINIIHNFRVPKEKRPVNKAYNHFNTWATSGGQQKADWYKDSDGYRNVNELVID